MRVTTATKTEKKHGQVILPKFGNSGYIMQHVKIFNYQNECPHEHVTGAWSTADASTALGHPGAGHHFMLVLSCTKLFVIKC